MSDAVPAAGERKLGVRTGVGGATEEGGTGVPAGRHRTGKRDWIDCPLRCTACLFALVDLYTSFQALCCSLLIDVTHFAAQILRDEVSRLRAQYGEEFA